METVLAIIGGLGIGSLLTQVVQHFLLRKSKQEDSRTEKLEQAFASLLTAYTDVIRNSNSQDHQLTFAMWEARIQLIASNKVIDAIEALKNTAPYSEARMAALSSMLAVMREDFCIAK